MSLDRNLVARLRLDENIFADETVQWIGKAGCKFRIFALELGGSDAISFGISFPFLIIIAVGFFAKYFSVQGNQMLASIIIAIGLILFFLPDFIRRHRRLNTIYAVTTNYIIFQQWRWGRVRVDYLRKDEIKEVVLVEIANGSGDLFFMTKHEPSFRTYDFVLNEHKHHPAFHEIDNVAVAGEFVMKLLT